MLTLIAGLVAGGTISTVLARAIHWYRKPNTQSTGEAE